MIKKRLLGFMSFCVGIAMACSTSLASGSTTPTDVDRVKGLQALYQLPAGTHVRHCDLSHSRLTKMPNLSMYTIDTLAQCAARDCRTAIPRRCRGLRPLAQSDWGEGEGGGGAVPQRDLPSAHNLGHFSQQDLQPPLSLEVAASERLAQRPEILEGQCDELAEQSPVARHLTQLALRWPLLLRLQAHPHP